MIAIKLSLSHVEDKRLPYFIKFSRQVNFANFAIQKKIAKLK